MFKASFFLISLLVMTTSGFCQNALLSTKADWYRFNQDVFTSASEKQLFQALASGKEVDDLSLYMASDSLAFQTSLKTIRERISTYLNSPSAGSAQKEQYSSKDLKKIYKGIHASFLSKYTDNPSFGELFTTGDYNCATATALYTLLLEELSVSYSIRETPQHVYLIAAPQSHNLLFETTAPGARFFQITEKAKDLYLEYLYSNKLISKEEWTSGDRSALFQKHFYTDEAISKRQLAGLLYYNKGVAAFNRENHREAYRNFEKAYFLYPSAKIKYFVSVSLARMLVEKGRLEDEHAYPYFVRFLQVNSTEIGSSALKEYMEAVSKKLLFQSPEPQKYREVYRAVASQIEDSALLKDIQYNHCYHTAHYFSIKNHYDSALLYLDSVHALNPKDLLVQELITNTVFEVLRLQSSEKAALEVLQQYFQRFSFLDMGSKVGEYYAYCLARITAQEFEKDNKTAADAYLSQIKSLLAAQPALSKKSEVYFTPAFLEVYYYHVRHREYKEAKAFLQLIGKSFPDNEEINRRKLRIEEILQNQ